MTHLEIKTQSVQRKVLLIHTNNAYKALDNNFKTIKMQSQWQINWLNNTDNKINNCFGKYQHCKKERLNHNKNMRCFKSCSLN